MLRACGVSSTRFLPPVMPPDPEGPMTINKWIGEGLSDTSSESARSEDSDPSLWGPLGENLGAYGSAGYGLAAMDDENSPPQSSTNLGDQLATIRAQAQIAQNSGGNRRERRRLQFAPRSRRMWVQPIVDAGQQAAPFIATGIAVAQPVWHGFQDFFHLNFQPQNPVWVSGMWSSYAKQVALTFTSIGGAIVFLLKVYVNFFLKYLC